MPGLWKPHGRPPDQSSLFDYDMKRHKHVLCYATENLPVTADSLTLIIHPEMETQMLTWESPNFSPFIPHITDEWSNFPEATKILVPWSVLEPRFPIPQWDLHKSLGRLVDFIMFIHASWRPWPRIDSAQVTDDFNSPFRILKSKVCPWDPNGTSQLHQNSLENLSDSTFGEMNGPDSFAKMLFPSHLIANLSFAQR